MSFFDPLPPPQPPATERQWSPPLWDRPSEGTIPCLLALNAIVHQTDNAVIEVESLAVYPNGFVVNLHIQPNPRTAQNAREIMRQPGGGRIPRVGVRFADGRTAGKEAGSAPFLHARHAGDKDADGIPKNVLVMMAGGGGGGTQGWRFGTWVYPLPPEGPLEVFVSVPQAGLDEGKVVVEGAEVLAASRQARVIWD